MQALCELARGSSLARVLDPVEHPELLRRHQLTGREVELEAAEAGDLLRPGEVRLASYQLFVACRELAMGCEQLLRHAVDAARHFADFVAPAARETRRELAS